MEAYTQTGAEVLAQQNSRESGLTELEAKLRLARRGPNLLDEPEGPSMLVRLARQFRDPMIVVLLAAAALSLVASGGKDPLDAVIILVIVAVNAVISILQENSAQKALEELKKLTAPQARVRREGRERVIDASDLVPGDVIVLEAGDYIPADGRLLAASALRTDESAMTGESVPAEKDPMSRPAEGASLGDWSNMVLSSTLVTAGRGTAVVTATGMDTQVGKIAGLLMAREENVTPLQRRMGEISKTLSMLCLGVCAVMFGAGLLRGMGMLELFLTAVSLAVAAIPEGLPAIVTIVLALGVQRMARKHAIVKKLPAVETLGAAGVICSDKTGTLTQNRMTVTKVWTFAPGGRKLALTIGALCSDARLDEGDKPQGEPTENALVAAALAEGLDKRRLEREYPRVGEVPFDSQRKLMTTIHPDGDGGYRVLVKGAPDLLVLRCGRTLNRGEREMTDDLRAAIENANDDMARQALRVLAVAEKHLDVLPAKLDAAALEWDLTFVGLIGMIDPPRPEVKAAVEACFQAGIRPVMITGDHKATAVAIARELGILRPGDVAMTGKELDFLPPEFLGETVEQCSVYARVSPEHKLRIIEAWRQKGQIVAMTGDGVNDAPALKAADIGCAMGMGGTDVAKGAADMILTDDNFSTIVSAVREGRGIYANIRKAIQYLLSCNLGEIFTLFTATLLGFHQMPLIPVQLLWLNLVTDSLPALALGVEPVEADVMEQQPRKASESLFNRTFARTLFWQGLLVGGCTLAAYWLGEYVLSDPSRGDAAANTMAFSTLTFCQLFHAFDVRSEHLSLFQLGFLSNPAMNKAFLSGLALQLAVLLLPPLQGIFSTVTMNLTQWVTVLALSVLPVLISETAKWAKKRPRLRGGARTASCGWKEGLDKLKASFAQHTAQRSDRP